MRFPVKSSWIDRLVKRQPQRYLHAVNAVNLSIAAGKTMALVGESGCGKSTVARCAAGLYTPSSGAVIFRGKNMTDIAAKSLPERREVQMIFQDPYASLNPRWRIGRSIADPIRTLGLEKNGRVIRDMVAELLTTVGLSPADAEKFPHEFSGGQRQRVAIARALSSRPSFIICDEPTSALDVSVQAQILNKMKDLQDQFGLTYLFISHDLGVVDHMSDVIGVMYLGNLVEVADRETLFEKPMHPYTRLLLGAVPRVSVGETELQPPLGELPNPMNPPSGCAFRTRCPFATSTCAESKPEMRRIGETQVACHRAEDIN
ncbi:ATP-binding cassette domain-containing protein [Rhizobiaceae bacterium BDR2-2]|uniref:ATP-binding cassette domain-containing protein n=2 Tax=Ectorhizobium quercum TaxID=2965071 RepID=A0AAE3MZA9_9HYPH|nr:oligopeptide/dipeptide ABC transporter ATP-binding protein [Ectorhizobium quercum]MCX8997122.1 ATP-binding cassette domain-containing protein [Ectorhizobium quercum]